MTTTNQPTTSQISGDSNMNIVEKACHIGKQLEMLLKVECCAAHCSEIKKFYSQTLDKLGNAENLDAELEKAFEVLNKLGEIVKNHIAEKAG